MVLLLHDTDNVKYLWVARICFDSAHVHVKFSKPDVVSSVDKISNGMEAQKSCDIFYPSVRSPLYNEFDVD